MRSLNVKHFASKKSIATDRERDRGLPLVTEPPREKLGSGCAWVTGLPGAE